MVVSILAFATLALLAGVLLQWAARRFARPSDPIVEQINALLPQTQCAQCSFPGCRPYAEAIARGEADINQCPPGGEAGIRALAQLLGREAKPLNAAHGPNKPPMVALIDESRCIGCVLCIKACPVDAIIGAAKHMHSVLEEDCTGCELCIAPCPVDCIEMVPAKPSFAPGVVWPTARSQP